MPHRAAPFLGAKIPVITIHSLTHLPIAVYLAYLDLKLD